MELAPKWAMAHIYTGDTLCRMHKAVEAWPYYEEGFDLGPNDLSLIALALQCLHDEKELLAHEDQLRALAAKHEGSWIAYLANDTLLNHEKNKGVDPKYRPRGYNEGPKEVAVAAPSSSSLRRRRHRHAGELRRVASRRVGRTRSSCPLPTPRARRALRSPPCGGRWCRSPRRCSPAADRRR